MKIAILNHGCAKNLIDSELMAGMLSSAGHKITLDETNADIVVVNTCSFIHDAETESVQTIVKMIDEGKNVIVTGCLPQKHQKNLQKGRKENLITHFLTLKKSEFWLIYAILGLLTVKLGIISRKQMFVKGEKQVF